MSPAVVPPQAQGSVDPRRSVGATIRAMDLVDLHGERLVLLLSLAGPPATPGVETAARDLEHLAHHADSEDLPMILDEPELHFWSSAKYANAFFKISRSSVTSRSFCFIFRSSS
jgi:hypothetical protein